MTSREVTANHVDYIYNSRRLPVTSAARGRPFETIGGHSHSDGDNHTMSTRDQTQEENSDDKTPSASQITRLYNAIEFPAEYDGLDWIQGWIEFNRHGHGYEDAKDALRSNTTSTTNKKDYFLWDGKSRLQDLDTGFYRKSPLHAAVNENNAEVLSLLLDFPNIDLETRALWDEQSYENEDLELAPPPLVAACDIVLTDMARILVTKGRANVEATDLFGKPVLTIAV